LKVNYCDDLYSKSYTLAHCTSPHFNDFSGGASVTIQVSGPNPSTPPTGNIVFYDTVSGGRVLQFGGYDSVRSLRELPMLGVPTYDSTSGWLTGGCTPITPGDTTLSDMVRRALDCMVNGNCPPRTPPIPCNGACPTDGGHGG
jgi:hypothetical protein